MKINYHSELLQIFKQYNTNSCTSNALSTIISFIISRQGCYSFPVSRLFIYYNTRRLINQTEIDNGSIPIVAIEAVNQFGICPETMWTFCPENIFQKPNDSCYDFGQQFPFLLEYDLFYISKEKSWTKTFLKHLLNGKLLLCSMKRDRYQHINDQGNITSIENPNEIWYHSICCLGIDEENKIVLFCNSIGVDEPYQGFFSFTFEQVENLDPIDDEIYALSGKFLNDKVMDQNMVTAIQEFKSKPFYDIHDLFTIQPTDFIEYSQVFDHIIVGAGITGRYLAYKISTEFPNDTILIVDNSSPSNDLTSLQFHDFGFESLFCSSACRYHPKISNQLTELFDDFFIPKGKREINYSISFDENHIDYIQDFNKNLQSFLGDEFGLQLDDLDNFEKNLSRMYLNNEISQMRVPALVHRMGYSIDYLRKNVFRRRIDLLKNFPAIKILKEFLCAVGDYENCELGQNMKDLLELFLQKFTKMGLGDFYIDNDYGPYIFLPNTHAIIESNHVLLSPSSLTNTILASSLMIRAKNIHKTFTKNSESYLVNYYEESDVLIYLILKDPVDKFDTIIDENWGYIHPLVDQVIACRDVQLDFFNQLKQCFTIPIKNNMEYKLCLFPQLEDFIHQNIEFEVDSMVIYHYDRYLGHHTPLLSHEKNLYHRIYQNFSIKSPVHTLNSNLSIMKLEFEGSLWLVQQFLNKITLRIGVFGEYKGKWWYDVQIPYSHYIYLHDNDSMEECENFLDSVQLVIFTGVDTSYYESRPMAEYLLKRIKEKNDRGFFLPCFLFCGGLHQLGMIEDPRGLEALVQVDTLDQTMKIFSVGENRGKFHEITHYYTDNHFAFDPEILKNFWNEYVLTGVSLSKENLYTVATVQHKKYPIYGFQGHPIHAYPGQEDTCLLCYQKIKEILFEEKYDHVLQKEIMILENPWGETVQITMELQKQYLNFIPILRNSHDWVVGIPSAWQATSEAIYIRNWGFFVDPFTFILSKPFEPRRIPEIPKVREYVISKGWDIVEISDGYFEGDADAIYSWDNKTLFLSYGVRTTWKGIEQVISHVSKGVQIIIIKKINSKWIHLDTCFKPIFDMCFYRPDAFDDKSIQTILDFYGPRAHPFPFPDCEFGLNFLWTYQYIILSDSVPREVCSYLAEKSKLEIITVPFSAAEKTNGSLFCCTLERPLWAHNEIVMASGTCRLFGCLNPVHRTRDNFNLTSIHGPLETFLGKMCTARQHLALLQFIMGDLILSEKEQEDLFDNTHGLQLLAQRIHACRTFIFEIASMKNYQRSRSNIPVQNDLKDPDIFYTNSPKELEKDIENLIYYVKHNFNNPIIIFLGPIRNWLFDSSISIINARQIIHTTLARFSSRSSNVFYIDPTVILTSSDMETEYTLIPNGRAQQILYRKMCATVYRAHLN